jgi:ribosomal protein S18 acetylase RimI-like enzyme
MTEQSTLKQISLRRATVDDAAAIAQVRIDSWRATYRGVIPDTYLDQMQVEESVLNWRIILDSSRMHAASDKVCVIVAECDGEVIGFCSANRLAEPKLGMDAEVTGIYLQAQWQRSGIGRRLLQKVARTCEQQGATGLLLWVLAANDIARHFVEELGAVKLSEQVFTWDGMDLKEVSYAWSSIAELIANLGAEISSPQQSSHLH